MSNVEKGNDQGFVQTVETMYSRLPDDLRERMIRVADSMLGIGDNDPIRDQVLTDWSLKAVHLYRLLGIDEKTIAEKVGRRLDSFLQRGREQDLSSGMERVPLLNGGDASKPATIATRDFQAKYNLDRFRQIKLSVDKFQSTDYYNTSLDTAFDLAARVKDSLRAREICLHMVRLGNFNAAYKTAEKLGDETTLINLGKLALVDFFDQYTHYGIHDATNRLSDAIESLKRVQGENKPTAAQMLYDLATEISSERFIQDYVRRATTNDPAELRNTILKYSLIALRATGTLIKRQRAPFIDVDFITRVENEKYRIAIKNLVRRVMKTADRPDLDEVKKSLQAIGDTESLNAYAEEFFEKRHAREVHNLSRFYWRAIEFFEAAGNNDSVRRVIDAAMTEGIIEPAYNEYECRLVPVMAKIGYVDGLERVRDLALAKIEKYSEADYHRVSWQNVLEKVERALARQPLNNDEKIEYAPKDINLPDYVREALVKEREYRQELERCKAGLTPERKRELIVEGYKLLRDGDAWNAYISFKDAAYRQGLIEAGDKLLERGDGINAITPYIFASLLPPENSPITDGERTMLIGG